MEPFPGYFDQSYPRSVLHPAPVVPAGAEAPAVLTELPAGGDPSPVPAGAGSQPVAGDTRGEDGPPATGPLTVTAGSPGTFMPPVRATDRPASITELTQRAVPAGMAPWDAGQFIPVGTSGRRAHWTGEEWRGGVSPGYTPAGTQFPGTGDSPEDLTR